MPQKSEFLPAGFRFCGHTCGIKASGKPDLALIVADSPIVAAGVYTQNQIVAAPVTLCRSRTPSAKIRAVIANSGNANACTGEQGMRDAKRMCQDVAELLGCDSEAVLVMSTGVIGHALPIEKISAEIGIAFDQLGTDTDSFFAAAEAIRTTDNARKTVTRSVTIAGDSYNIAAMAKGAGMIAPNMATMLAVVMTDAPLSSESADQLLKTAASESFNRVSVDGHTSTNDTLLLLASGTGQPLVEADLEKLQIEMTKLSIELAKRLVTDGEGAAHVMAIDVVGADNDDAALVIAKTIAASPLVKTAMTGGDPNWGRIVSAAGYAEAKIEPTKTCLRICGEEIYRNGSPVAFNATELSKKMKSEKEVPVEITVGDGKGQAKYWSSDLTCDYVRFNSEYTT